ncbi:pectin lyase-like protein [Flagelloscypha sp. PMI_526]|nr:pectin lyase-like protein [Flagelloscypha sp. PMI_526]
MQKRATGNRNMLSSAPALLFLLFAPCVFGLSPKWLKCQVNPKHCPKGTIRVSQNETDLPHFSSVQEAVLSLPEGKPSIIWIGSGEYEEYVNITTSSPLTFLGQLPPSALTVPLPQYNGTAFNTVVIHQSGYIHMPGATDDADTVTFTIAPSRAHALIGAGPKGAPLVEGFGVVDFKAYNIAFENRAGQVGQALATDISYANASFYGCSFAGWQDTWYTGRNASTYVYDSIIYGQTDYLFGFGTAWFENTVLANRACGGGIIAWKGTNLTDAPGNRYGAYISNSRIIKSPDANVDTLSCWLGRSWNELAVTVLLNTYMEDVVQPGGWTHFSATPDIPDTVFYGEFNDTGPGSDTSQRVPQTHLLSEEEASNFTVPKVFLEQPKWIDCDYKSSFDV